MEMTWNFRRSLARWATRLCGACAGCATGCSALSGGASEPLPAKAPSSEQSKFSELWHGEELVNDVIHRLWPSISEWFRRKLKAELEPELKKQLLDIVEFEDLGLGTAPMRLEGITSSMCTEEWDDNVLKVIKCAGDLDYSGDGEITVGIRAGRGGAMGRVVLTDLRLKGKIVLELAQLIPVAPWFTGVRIYFPDMPQVDLNIDAKVFVLDAFCDTAALVKTKVLKVLREAVASVCVLPSRLVLESSITFAYITRGLREFFAHKSRPEAQNPPAAEAPDATSSAWGALNSWLFTSAKSTTDLTSMEVRLRVWGWTR
ncbi:unnamed protein product [Effrenium voratum]|uniref:SMP-LTD domain-containing protein n=1 Tax=Effrenium voratum TaxID=2562239 RepID=A0AA36I8J2_9DINO|nr:unnamed protein product [Effrenium voratum]